ncbi:hypothetical protein Aperf_G00000001353 [Anoplocephala perfoliata]
METNSDSKKLVRNIRERIAELNNRTIQVSHLPSRIKLKDLTKYFKTAVNARFPSKSITGKRRYAFLEFASAEAAEQACQKASSVEFKGELPKCELVAHKSDNKKFKSPESYQMKDFCLQSLSISCLPRSTTDGDIRALFPKLKNLNLPNQGFGKTLGFAKVTFSSKVDALSAFESKHGTILYNSPIIVNFSLRKKSGISKAAKMRKIKSGKAEEEFEVLKNRKKAKRAFEKRKKTLTKELK